MIASPFHGDARAAVTIVYIRITSMAHSSIESSNSAAGIELLPVKQVHLEQLKKVELINGRAAMVGIIIGVVLEGLTGFGIVHQIGLGTLIDGYASCKTQFLPFCF